MALPFPELSGKMFWSAFPIWYNSWAAKSTRPILLKLSEWYFASIFKNVVSYFRERKYEKIWVCLKTLCWTFLPDHLRFNSYNCIEFYISVKFIHSEYYFKGIKILNKFLKWSVSSFKTLQFVLKFNLKNFHRISLFLSWRTFDIEAPSSTFKFIKCILPLKFNYKRKQRFTHIS